MHRVAGAYKHLELLPPKYRKDEEGMDGCVVVSGLWTTRKIGRGSGEESILKKSSAFLSNFTHPADKIRKSNNSDGRKQSNRCGESSSARYPSFKGYLSLLNDHLDPFQRAPTVQTLLVERRKTNGVKKSVSFSSDTSFEEKRAPYKRAAVHEVKVYHKGVLQGMRFFPSLSFPFILSSPEVKLRSINLDR